MPKPLRTQFVIADGVRARWVSRSDDANDFVTLKKIHATHAPGHRSPAIVLHASSGRSFRMERREVTERERRTRFAQEVADAINEQVAAGAVERLAVIAPSRVLNAISERMSAGANAKLAGTLAKDLTRTPDHQLGTWLRALERG